MWRPEAGGEQSVSSTIYQSGSPGWFGGRWGTTHDAIDGRRLKYGVFLRGWSEAALLLLLQIEFYVNKRTVSLHLFQLSVIL